jgi:UDP-N-acetylmuramoyl-tripeptide--D-alanyl-D-alanine ligase
VHFTGAPMRCEVSQVQGVTIINDAYNACPTSMQAALRALWETPQQGRRFVICGDMLELGPQAESFHRELGEAIVQAAAADGLIACGQWAETIASAAQAAGMPADRIWAGGDYQRHLPLLAAVLRPGDTVLVKASRAARLEGAAENLKKLLAEKPKRHFPPTESLLFTLPAGGMKDFTAPANRI